jgi:hypothetical protein
MSRKFFLLPGIFPLKIENHLQKFHKKIRRVRSRFVIGSVDPALLTSPRPLLANKRHAGRNAGTSALLPLAVMVACPINVRFTPKSGHSAARPGCPLCAKSGLMQCSKNALRAYGALTR